MLRSETTCTKASKKKPALTTRPTNSVTAPNLIMVLIGGVTNGHHLSKRSACVVAHPSMNRETWLLCHNGACGSLHLPFLLCPSGRVWKSHEDSIAAIGCTWDIRHPTVSCLKLPSSRRETTKHNADTNISDLFGEALESFICAFQILHRSAYLNSAKLTADE